MDFISQYILANTGTTVPIRYTRWAAISLLSTTLGRKVYTEHNHFQLLAWMYFIFIGPQGSGKSTAKDQAKEMYIKAFPEMPTGVSITSREDITRFMASDHCVKIYTNERGETIEWRPVINYVDELANFLSFSPGPMIEFMTTIFDSKHYDSSTIKRGKETIVHPYFAFLACTVPETMISYMRMAVVTGGFLRRTFMIYDTTSVRGKAFPEKNRAAYEAEEWCIKHLQKIDLLVGPFSWAPGSREFLDKWNESYPIPDIPVLAGYYGKKVNLVQKVSMCIACAQENPKLEHTIETLELAIAFIDANEDNLPALTAAVGRNPLAVPQAKLLQQLAEKGGWMHSKQFQLLASQDLNEGERKSVMELLRQTDQIFYVYMTEKGTREQYISLPDKYFAMVKAGEIGNNGEKK